MSTATVIKADAVQMVFLERRAADRELQAAATRQRVEVDAAYQSGVADGRRAAEADGLAAMPRLAAAIDGAVAGLGEALAERAAADADTLVGFATEIARWILGRELETDPAAVLGRIEAALDGLSVNSRLIVRVAPEAVELVSRWAEGRDADVIGDPSLTPGEARLAGGAASADLTWAPAFSRVREAFGRADQETAAAEGAGAAEPAYSSAAEDRRTDGRAA
jgi:flagellar biosynthesis/type III secretory pathway protein FliH